MKTVTQEIQEAYQMYDAKSFQHWWCINKDRLKETEKQQIIDAFEHNPKVKTNEKGTLISISGIDYYNENYGSTNKCSL